VFRGVTHPRWWWRVVAKAAGMSFQWIHSAQRRMPLTIQIINETTDDGRLERTTEGKVVSCILL